MKIEFERKREIEMKDDRHLRFRHTHRACSKSHPGVPYGTHHTRQASIQFMETNLKTNKLNEMIAWFLS